jgi:hypothetical protein
MSLETTGCLDVLEDCGSLTCLVTVSCGSVPVRSPELSWVLRPFEEASELLGHHPGQRREHDGCAIGTRHRHMTSEMQAPVLPVIEQHLATMWVSIMTT